MTVTEVDVCSFQWYYSDSDVIFKPNPLADALSDCRQVPCLAESLFNMMLWITDIFGGFFWYDPTRNSFSETVFRRSRAKQRLFRPSGSCWVIVRLVYIAHALRTFTCRALSPESILVGTDPFVVSIAMQPEAFLTGECLQSVSGSEDSLAEDSLPGCTFLIFCSRKCTHFTEKSFSREQRMR